jgi:ubiquinone/menaquinone biosynthesis C-methylase UbiE
VLDLGSGPGFWTIPIAHIVGLDGRVIALDVSRELLNALSARNPPSHVETLEAELPLINLREASVDVIWAAFIFHEVQPPADLASEMRRVLRPGGRLDVLDWHPEASSNGGPPRQHRFLPEQVSEYLRAAGFHDIQEIWQNEDAYLLAAA